MAGPSTSGNGQITKREATGAAVAPRKEGGLPALLQTMGPEIARALPKHITPDRMMRACLTSLRTTPKLAECTPASFMASVLASAQLGLEPGPLGLAYFVPYNTYNKTTKKYETNCQLIIGYAGMIELAYRSGRVASVRAMVVRKGDVFQFCHGLKQRLEHEPSSDPNREEQPITHAYAIAEMKGEEPIFWVLSHPQIEARRKRGASGKTYPDGNRVKTPWDDDYEAMAMKSAVRALFKWIPKSPEMMRAVVADEAQEQGRTLSFAMPEIGEALLGAGLKEEPIETEIVDADPTAEFRDEAARIDRGEV